MKFTLFIARYIGWHYGKGLEGFFLTWWNVIWFIYHFFSIPLLIRTLFEPFQRLQEKHGKGLDMAQIASAIAVNTIMRLVGATARGAVIAVGIIMLAFALAGGFVLLVSWLLLPFLVLTLVTLGINGLMRLL